MIGRGNHDRIHRLVVQNAAEVLHGFGRFALGFPDSRHPRPAQRRIDALGVAGRRRLVEQRGVDVGQIGNPAIGPNGQVHGQGIAAAADADDSQHDLLVCRRGAARAPRRRDGTSGNRAQSVPCAFAKKTSPCQRAHIPISSIHLPIIGPYLRMASRMASTFSGFMSSVRLLLEEMM